jgi:hypothetical protein
MEAKFSRGIAVWSKKAAFPIKKSKSLGLFPSAAADPRNDEITATFTSIL